MSAAAWAVQQAIGDALKADAALQAALGGSVLAPKVWHHADTPQGAVLPYITLGSKTEQPDDDFGTDGNAGTLTVDLWADVVGPIYVHVVRVLSALPVSLPDGHHLDDVSVALTATPRDPSGCEHGVVTVRPFTSVSA